ncbi:MAG: LysR family transcriptional regulator [Ruminococcaceae bacterium]|nr:LysR family transcriptional regulator [Oscillospiraceae bacterium]
MELTQLQYFAAVADSLHMTHTAERLHVAQPALSQAISRLERELGVALFSREGRHLTLTPYGRFLKERLRTPLSVLEGIPRELREMTSFEKHTVRLNVMAATSLVTDAIIEYQKRHADIRFCLLQNAEEDCDLSVGTSAAPPTDGSVTAFDERIFLAVPIGSRYAEGESVRLADMANENFISLAGQRRLRGICDSFCMQAGFTPRVVFESDNPTSVKNLIAAHAGVGFWPEYSFGICADAEVKLLPLSDVESHRYLVLEERNRHEETHRFFLFLCDYIAMQKERASQQKKG